MMMLYLTAAFMNSICTPYRISHVTRKVTSAKIAALIQTLTQTLQTHVIKQGSRKVLQDIDIG